jgi:hypothetical protein
MNGSRVLYTRVQVTPGSPRKPEDTFLDVCNCGRIILDPTVPCPVCAANATPPPNPADDLRAGRMAIRLLRRALWIMEQSAGVIASERLEIADLNTRLTTAEERCRQLEEALRRRQP